MELLHLPLLCLYSTTGLERVFGVFVCFGLYFVMKFCKSVLKDVFQKKIHNVFFLFCGWFFGHKFKVV